METWTEYMLLTLLSQCKLALPARNKLLRYKIIGVSKKFKHWPRPLFRPKTDQAYHQKANTPHETVPLSLDVQTKYILMYNHGDFPRIFYTCRFQSPHFLLVVRLFGRLINPSKVLLFEILMFIVQTPNNKMLFFIDIVSYQQCINESKFIKYYLTCEKRFLKI